MFISLTALSSAFGGKLIEGEEMELDMEPRVKQEVDEERGCDICFTTFPDEQTLWAHRCDVSRFTVQNTTRDLVEYARLAGYPRGICTPHLAVQPRFKSRRTPKLSS